MSLPPQEQFPSPENQPPGRSALNSLFEALSDEPVGYQNTSRSIEAIYLMGRSLVEVNCGDSDTPVGDYRPGYNAHLSVTIGRLHNRSFGLGELATPEGVEAFRSSVPPTKRKYYPGEEPQGELSDVQFDLAMSDLKITRPEAVVRWVHEALRLVQLPHDHSSTGERVRKIIDMAKATPEVPLRIVSSLTMVPIRVVGGWELNATWQSANEAALEHAQAWGNDKIRICLEDFDRQKFMYTRDADDKESVIAEVKRPEEYDVLRAIGYTVRSECSEDSGPPPPDSALLDFAQRTQSKLEAQRLGKHDIFMGNGDGTVTVRRPDGTTYGTE